MTVREYFRHLRRVEWEKDPELIVHVRNFLGFDANEYAPPWHGRESFVWWRNVPPGAWDRVARDVELLNARRWCVQYFLRPQDFRLAPPPPLPPP